MEPTEPLERLAAALMLVDPAVTLIDRAPGAVFLKGGPLMQYLLIDAADPETFEGRLRAAIAAAQARRALFIVSVVSDHARATDIVKVLKRVVPYSLFGFRSPRRVWVWTPGGKAIAVRGPSWPTLSRAVKRVNAGDVGDAAAITAQRGAQADELEAFMTPLLQRTPYVTWSIAALSVATFGLQMLWGNGEPTLASPRMGALLRSLIEEGQVWRLLAPMLLHGSIAHVVMNMIALFSFGTFLERLVGWRRYLLLYVLSGLGGSLASAFLPGERLSVGASGGIWGLMVAGAVLVTWPRGKLPVMLLKLQRRRAWTPLAINILYSFQPGIDLFAHFGGGLTGGLLVLSGLITAGVPAASEVQVENPTPPREPFVVSAAAALSGVALLGSLLVAVATGRPWELQSSPALRAVNVKHAQLQLPTLISPSGALPDGHTFSFGSLNLDPIAFVLYLPDATMTVEEAKDPEGQLRGALGSFQPALYTDFSETIATELRHHNGRPYLFHQQTTKDGRVGDSYFLTDDTHMFSILVLSSNGVSAPWRAAAAAVPFSVRFR